MTNYREILRLHSLGNSQRSIAGEVHSSRDTVADAIKAAKAASITWPLDDDVTNEDIQEILFPGKYVFASPYTAPTNRNISTLCKSSSAIHEVDKPVARKTDGHGITRGAAYYSKGGQRHE